MTFCPIRTRTAFREVRVTGNVAIRLIASSDVTKHLRSRLYTNAAYLWLAAAAFTVLGFVFWTVVARLYSPEMVGLAGATITSFLLLGQIAQLGLGYALIRFIPQSESGAAILVSRSLVAVAGASLLIGLLFLGSLFFWSPELKDLLWNSPGHAGAYLGFVILAGVAGLLRFVFIAFQRGGFVLVSNILVGTLRIPLAVFLGGLGSAYGIVTGHGLALLVVSLLAAVLLLPRCTGHQWLPLKPDVWKLRPMAPFALSNQASHVLTVLGWQLLPLPVIALLGADAAGFFYIGWAVAGLALAMTQQLALSLFAEGSNNPSGFRSQIRGAFILGVGLAFLFAIAVYFLGDFILLLFGREYVEQSRDLLKVLSAAMPLAAVTYIYLGAERIRRRMKQVVGVSALVTVVMLGAIAVLVPRMGIVGAGYGVVAGYGAGALISLLLLYPMMKGSYRLISTGQSTAP